MYQFFRYRQSSLLICLLLLLVYRWLFLPFQFSASTFPPDFIPQKSANATLGFGKIIAVSTTTSVRRKSLIASANITGLDISIPDQPSWTESDILRLKAKQGSKISKGSALAWMGHLNALRWFLLQSFDTALIIEDDVDWDIHIRLQVLRVSYALHQLFQKNIAHSESAKSMRHELFWPESRYWDIIYLGHCGDPLPFNLSLVHSTVPDLSMSAFQQIHPHILPKHRLIHQSVSPLCTFAYAINKESARRILKDFSHEEEDHGTGAYDIRILEACRDLGWNCWTVAPELFHHISGPSEIKATDFPDNVVSDTKGEGEILFQGPRNIVCGIRKIIRQQLTSSVIEIIRLATRLDTVCPVLIDEWDWIRTQNT